MEFHPRPPVPLLDPFPFDPFPPLVPPLSLLSDAAPFWLLLTPVAIGPESSAAPPPPPAIIIGALVTLFQTKVPPPPAPASEFGPCVPICPTINLRVVPLVRSIVPVTTEPLLGTVVPPSPIPPLAPDASILYLPVWGTTHSWIPWVFTVDLFAKLVPAYAELICCWVGPFCPVAPAFVKVKISVGSALLDCELVW